jgi:large subunit ribosomal protein L17
MRHLKSFNKLNRTHSHRKVLYKNMSISLFRHGRIKTTKAKAKEIRRISEKLITRAKVKTLHNIRIISKLIKDKAIIMKLFDEIAPVYVDRNGGYTRIVKLGRRKGDGADMAYLELIQENQVSRKKKKKKKIEPETVADKKEVKEVKPEAKKEEAKKEEVKKEKPKKEVKASKTKKEKEKETTKVDLKTEVDTEKQNKLDQDKKAEEVKIKKEKIKVEDKKKKKKE